MQLRTLECEYVCAVHRVCTRVGRHVRRVILIWIHLRPTIQPQRMAAKPKRFLSNEWVVRTLVIYEHDPS